MLQQRPPTVPTPTLYEMSRPATSATSATPTRGTPTAAMMMASSPSGDAMQVEGFGGRAMTASVDMSKMSEAGDAADALLGLCYGRRSALVSSTECA